MKKKSLIQQEDKIILNLSTERNVSLLYRKQKLAGM